MWPRDDGEGMWWQRRWPRWAARGRGEAGGLRGMFAAHREGEGGSGRRCGRGRAGQVSDERLGRRRHIAVASLPDPIWVSSTPTPGAPKRAWADGGQTGPHRARGVDCCENDNGRLPSCQARIPSLSPVHLSVLLVPPSRPLSCSLEPPLALFPRHGYRRRPQKVSGHFPPARCHRLPRRQ